MPRQKLITPADLRDDPTPLIHNPSYFINRLEAAEAVALMFGWSASRRHEGFRERATYALWSKWLDLVGGGNYARPKLHPQLDDEAVRPIVQEDEELERATREKLNKIVVEVPA